MFKTRYLKYSKTIINFGLLYILLRVVEKLLISKNKNEVLFLKSENEKEEVLFFKSENEKEDHFFVTENRTNALTVVHFCPSQTKMMLVEHKGS